MKIKTILIINQQISVIFEQSWFQEDIETLSQLILVKLPKHIIKEVTFGADRENIRFQWQHAEFMMNFDYYSQSCWINAQDENSLTNIEPLYNFLTKS